VTGSVPVSDLQGAVRCLSRGGVIAYPTESSFGLGCDPDNLSALQRILDIKQRDADKGLIILVSSIDQAKDYLLPLNELQRMQIATPRTRATTWLIERQPQLSHLLCGQHPKLAVRVTTHPIARQLCELMGKPLVSTSCNLSGDPALYDTESVKRVMGDLLDLVIAGEVGGQSASQIIDLESGKVIRE